MPRPIDLNPLLEGAILLALDELIAGRSMAAMNVLIAARTSVELYDRARAMKAVNTLRLVSRVIEGEYP